MSSEPVRQLAALADLFQRALELSMPESVAVLGIAGGNGLDRIDPSVTKRIVGCDINPEYLAATARRYAGLPGLELHCVDLARGRINLSPVRLVHAALIFEHAGFEGCLDGALSLVAPQGGLSVVLQLPSDSEPAVGRSQYASIEGLRREFQLIPPVLFCEAAGQRGMRLRRAETLPVASGKALWFAMFEPVE